MGALLSARSSLSMLVALGFTLFIVSLAATELLLTTAQESPPCQEPPRNPEWPIFQPGAIVHTDFDSSLSNGMRDQILKGLESWNNSASRLCSGVEFTNLDPDYIEPNRPDPPYVHS